MSYIDCFKHREVGTIAGIPLYQALENIDGDEFKASNGQYILGGGSGEHSAIVIKSAQIAINCYLSEIEDVDDSDDLDLDDELAYRENLLLDSWSMREYYETYKTFLKEGFNQDKDGFLEYHINVRIGALILNDSKLNKLQK